MVETGRGAVAATRRADRRIAAVEARVAGELSRRGAPVPRPLAFDGTWLIQEAVEGRRLSQVLATAPPDDGLALLEAALDALDRCYRAGADAGLAARVPPVPDAAFLLAGIDALGAMAASPPPPLGEAVTRRLARTPRAGFVKGDARPANALVTDAGTVVWLDWEHACLGHEATDLDWLLGDEWVPDWPAVEERLMAPRLARLAPSLAAQGGADYVRLYGTLHALMRLAAILRLKGRGPWWDAEACLEHETRGVTVDCAGRLCRRAARWAARSEMTTPLVPWIEDLAAALRLAQ